LRKSSIISSSTFSTALLEAENGIDWHSLKNWLCPTFDRLSDKYWYASGMCRHAITSYDLAGHIQTFHHGFFAAFWGLIFGMISAPFQLFFVSDKWARKAGSFGCLFGLLLSALYTVKDILVSVLVFFDRIIIGITNGCFRKDFDYVLDPSWKAQVHQTPLIASELEAFLTQGIPKARKADLVEALDCVVAARKVFENAHPCLPRDHRHFVVVKLPDLIKVIGTDDSKLKLRLNDEDVDLLRDRLLTIPKRSLGIHQESSRRLLADKMGASRILQRIQDESRSLLSETEPEVKKAQAEAFTSYQARLNSIVQKLTPSYHQGGPEETDVSFSLFLQALQPVCGRRILQAVTVPAFFSPSSVHLSPLNENRDEDDFSEYLT
jgi:hypothetical protein